MVLKLKLRRPGNRVGVVLPKDVLVRLNAKEGERFATQMAAAKSVIRRYRHTLRNLAK